MIIVFLISLFGFILLNIPISFSLLLTAVILMLYMGNASPYILVQSIVRGIDSFPLLAIPFFMLAGEIMNVGGISKRIVNFAKALIGYITGGLGYVTVLSSMVFAGVSGSAVADTSAIGSVLLPIMKEENYKVGKSTALICTAGCIGPVIPPSIPMILYGVTAGVSIVKLFLGGIVPGILIGLALMTIWFFHARKERYNVGIKFSIKELVVSTKNAFMALMLPGIILGGIVSGIVTPTESAVIAVVYAFIIGKFVYKELKISDMPRILVMTARSTAVVLLVCGCAMAAGYYITTAQVPKMLADSMLAISDNPNVIMLIVNILLLLVGCVMDLSPAILLMTPILLPIVTSFGFDPVYFGVVVCVNLCISLVTPPVGTVLYVGCGLSKISMFDLAKPLLPFLVAMITVLLLITYVPGLITFIPSILAK
jgi:tripartite ATP-independent transporter DctM subunit